MKRFPSSMLLGASTLVLAFVACGDDSADGVTSSTGSTGTTSPPTSSPSSGPGGQGGEGDGGATSGGGGDPGPGPSSTGAGGEGAGGPCGGEPVFPGEYDCACATGEVGDLTEAVFAQVSGVPLQMKQFPGDPTRFLVALKNGLLVVVENGVELDAPFLDLTAQVQDDGEQGLLGVAFHPDYPTNGRFFVNYTSPETYVAEYQVSAEDPLVANPTEVGRVIQVESFQSNHNGGAVEVGPDGFLYVSVGDGGEQGDPNCRAQDIALRAGKILRADISTPGTYSGAAGNWPGADEYVFDLGLRNPWRMSFDACTGDLWVADVGQNEYEEVNVQSVADGPLNFGWNPREGAHDFGDCAATGDLVDPVLDYQHAEGNSITGGYVYRGTAIPALRGAYVFGDYGSGTVWMARYAVGDSIPVSKTTLTGLGGSGIVAFAQDESGEVYILKGLSNGGGGITRIDPG